MQAPTVTPLWAGRTAALLGILLIALNLRTAVAAISPIVALVSDDIPLGSVGLGLLGALPPIAFALSGLVAPLVARRFGLEGTLVLACAAMVLGPVVRAIAPNYPVLVVGTVLALAGMGFGNILLPPAVKKYFPDRIGQLTTAYATLLALSTAVPAVLAAPMASVAGWRWSVAIWALFAFTALVPWLMVGARARRGAVEDAALIDIEPEPHELGRMWHAPTAWALAVVLAVSAFEIYAFFAWLPQLLIDRIGSTPAQAGALLALYGLAGLPAALIVPAVVTRVRNAATLVVIGVVLFVLGYLGLLLFGGTATWLWVLLAGTGPLLFPLALTLINLRTRSHAHSAALSGFVQAVGYGAGALGPLTVGLVHDLSGGWDAPLIFVAAISLAALPAAVVLSRGRFVEDELARR